jgi:hypothetical protein
MNFWEQFAMYQASAALNTIILKYAASYFTPEEMAACTIALNALSSLPERLHKGK